MKKLVYILLFALASCASARAIKDPILSTEGHIARVNRGRVTIIWECLNPDYKGQPCYSYSEHPDSLFTNPKVGDKIKMYENIP